MFQNWCFPMLQLTYVSKVSAILDHKLSSPGAKLGPLPLHLALLSSHSLYGPRRNGEVTSCPSFPKLEGIPQT